MVVPTHDESCKVGEGSEEESEKLGEEKQEGVEVIERFCNCDRSVGYKDADVETCEECGVKYDRGECVAYHQQGDFSF